MRWQDIEDEAEKYQAYLCSREWGEIRAAVRARSGGKCERCRRHKIDAVHHLTYARRYHERLADVMGVCDPCHQYEHGHSDYDPLSDRELTEYQIPPSIQARFAHCKTEADEMAVLLQIEREAKERIRLQRESLLMPQKLPVREVQ